VYFEFQGNTPPAGSDIQRTIYMSNDGRADNSASWQQIQASYRPNKNATLREAIDLINQHVAEQSSPKKSFIITYKEELIGGFLADYPNAQAAYSVRKLSTNYTGNAMEVRNSSGTLLDIGFDSNGNLDTASLATHIGTGTGTVTTWYDQSGNSRDLTQSVLSVQPSIAVGGTIHTINNIPAVLFANDYMDTAAFAPNPNGEVNILAVSQWDNTTMDMIVANQFGSSTTTRNYYYRMKSDGTIQMSQYFGNAQAQILNPSSATAANVPYIMSAEFASNTSNAYFNGTLRTGTTQSGSVENDTEKLRMGALGSNGTQLLRGYVQEFVYWSNSAHLDANDISNDVNNYYSAF
jgi:hypothetical protein